jgi:hypothetical protein
MAGLTDGGRGGIPWRPIGWGAAGLILLAPLAAMQVSEEMDWNAFDFALLGGLLAVVGLGLELAVRRGGGLAYRAGAGLALVTGVLLILVNGAVGIFGSEDERANLLFFGVLAVGLAGAAAARFRARGMAWAMVAAALAQCLVPVAASALDWAPAAQVWSPEVLAATGVFAALWLAAACLFRRA